MGSRGFAPSNGMLDQNRQVMGVPNRMEPPPPMINPGQGFVSPMIKGAVPPPTMDMGYDPSGGTGFVPPTSFPSKGDGDRTDLRGGKTTNRRRKEVNAPPPPSEGLPPRPQPNFDNATESLRRSFMTPQRKIGMF